MGKLPVLPPPLNPHQEHRYGAPRGFGLLLEKIGEVFPGKIRPYYMIFIERYPMMIF